MTELELEIQQCSRFDRCPSREQLTQWLQVVLADQPDRRYVSLCMRLVDEVEMTDLNESYRHKEGGTNVLSFPCHERDEAGYEILGDLVLCSERIAAEAEDQGKQPEHHWAHIVIHGLLHLLGYDHIELGEAKTMEGLESRYLSVLGIEDPYHEAIESGAVQ